MSVLAQTGREAVYATCRNLLADGRLVAPRGERTREIVAYTLRVADPADMLADGIGHVDFRPKLARLEAWHLITGEPYGEAIQHVTSDLGSRRWTEVPELNYGFRLRDQLDGIAQKLKADPDTRQAVGMIWAPDDLAGGKADYLCATQVQFLLREGALQMIVTMRSNDAWHGLPYNLYQFGALQGAMAAMLRVGLGTYTHNVGSMHLYERHWAKARTLHPPGGNS